MKRRVIVLILIQIFIVTKDILAQDSKEYKAMSADIEQSIWGTKDPIFEINTVPPEYKNESAVVIAQKVSLNASGKSKKGPFSKGYMDKMVLEKFRKKILINDQNSLNDFSQISFEKLDSKEGKDGFAFGGFIIEYTFLGIRIIKPDGTIHKINIDEIGVTTKVTTEGKIRKVAIPNLVIGDIIDYYIASYNQEQVITYDENQTAETLQFDLYDEYPILNYSINIAVDKSIALEYQSINNAPSFTVSQNENGNVLELTATNIKKAKDITWVSEYRQNPIIRVRYKLSNLNKDEFEIKKGQVNKVSNNSKRVEKEIQNILKNKFSQIYFNDTRLTALNKQFDKLKNNLEKTNPNLIASKDSLAYLAYYLWRNNCFFGEIFDLKDDMQNVNKPINLDEQLLNSLRMRSIYENTIKINCEFVDATSKNSVTRNNLFELNDLSILNRINAPTTKYVYFGNPLYNYGEVPAFLENGDGAYFSIKPDKNFLGKVEGYIVEKEGNIILPALTKEDHNQETSLSVSIDPSDNQTLNFTREVKAKGQLRRNLQAALLLPEDVVKEERAFLGLPTDLVEEYKSLGRAQKKNYEEFTTILKKARDTEKEKFVTEVNEELGEKIKELKSFTVLNRGLHHTNNVFHMKQEYSVNAWVKKAGNNLIVEVGKFVGGQFEIKADQRERKLDIYMPHARIYTYNVEFTIPTGFTIEGIDKLNKKVENECGGFVSTAVINGDKLIITTKKYYNNIEEKAANWTKLTAFIDAAFEFTKEKVLLKKK